MSVKKIFEAMEGEYNVLRDQTAQFLRQGNGDTSAIHLAGRAVIEHIEELLSSVPASEHADVTDDEDDIDESETDAKKMRELASAPTLKASPHANINDPANKPQTPASAVSQSAVVNADPPNNAAPASPAPNSASPGAPAASGVASNAKK